MKKYKVLNANMISPRQNYQYEIGKQYHCDDFDTDTTDDCSRGFYATDIDGLPYTFRCTTEQRVFECEVSGRSVEIPPYKCRYENITLVREVEKSEIVELAKAKENQIGYLLSEVLYPVKPLEITEHPEIDREKLLRSWASVWDSVRASVWDSVWAYISSLFPGIKKWKYIDHQKGVNPFQPSITLWRAGYVHSYDGITWRLHAGKNAEVVLELKL